MPELPKCASMDFGDCRMVVEEGGKITIKTRKIARAIELHEFSKRLLESGLANMAKGYAALPQTSHRPTG